MSQVADLTREFILASGAITGYESAPFRDDAAAPFKNKNSKILQSDSSSAGADINVSEDVITLYLITPCNPTPAQVKACMTDAESVKKLILRNLGGYGGKIFNFALISGVDGPYFDSQGRKGYGLTVRALSNSLC